MRFLHCTINRNGERNLFMGILNIQYKNLKSNDIERELFRHFIRHQTVTKCIRKVEGKWCVKDDPFVDDWSEEDYAFLVRCLKNTADTGGLVLAAMLNGTLKGFVSVESLPMGTKNQYRDLSSIHVSEDMRGQGIGRELFNYAVKWTREQGAEKLYISSHSAIESQAFYKAMGCVEAEEYNKEHVEKEPYDCQLEYIIK